MFFLNLLKPFVNGAIFGAAVIIPGADSGTMLVVFGSYDKICGALALDFKHIRRHLAFLLSFALGAVLGLGIAVITAAYLIENHPIPTFLFFIGLIAGSLPTIARKLFEKGKPKAYYALFALAGLAVVIAIDLMSGTPAAEAVSTFNLMFVLRLIICCFAAAAAMIIPGLSGSFLLMLFGVYGIVLGAARSLDFTVLIPSAAGILGGIIFGAKLIKWLFARFYTAVYCIIAGLMAGSMIALIPYGIGFNITLVIGIAAFAVGLLFTVLMGANREA